MDAVRAVSVLYRKMSLKLNAELASLGLTHAKAAVLLCLHANGEVTQVRICRELGLDKGSVAKMMVRLDADGLISRRTHPSDSRAVLVTLSESAKVLIPQIEEIHKAWVNEITADLSKLEKRNFLELLEIVSRTASELCEESDRIHQK